MHATAVNNVKRLIEAISVFARTERLKKAAIVMHRFAKASAHMGISI
jgi:hypothetical protein